MEAITDYSSALDLLMFAAIAMIGLLRWRRRGDAASMWFSAMALSLVVAVSVGFALPTGVTISGGRDLWLARITIASMALFPYLLYRFMTEFSRPPRSIKTVATLLTSTVAIWSLLLPSIPADDEPTSLAFALFIIAFLAHWTIMSVIVTVFFWRAGSHEVGIGRRRLQTLSIASALMAITLLASAAPGAGSYIGVVFVQAMGVVATLLLLVAFSPPTLVRAMWRAQEAPRTQAASSKLLEAVTGDEVIARLLQLISKLMGARNAALFAQDGTLLGARDANDSDVLAAMRAHAFDDAHVPSPKNPMVIRHSVLGIMVIATGSTTPYFAPAEIAAVDNLIGFAELVHDRVVVIDREREANQQLRELDQLKNDFVAMVAHDLRSPMTVIAGFADTVHDRWDTLEDDRKLEFLRLISRNTKTLAVFVEDVLQVTRIESGEFTYDFRPFDPRALIERTVAEIESTYHDAVVSVTSAPDLPLAYGDEERNWQILTNLLTNAIKFSPESPHVHVDVTTEPNENMLHVAITDHGIGISDEDQGRLFQKFSRIPANGHPKIKGTGLGLYICKSMIEAHGGKIWVNSEPSRGSTFTYSLPIAQPEVL